jgi:hypothetical protein
MRLRGLYILIGLLLVALPVTGAELWVAPAIDPPDTEVGDWAVAGKGRTHFGFAVPADMSELLSVKVVVIGGDDTDTEVDLYLSVAQNTTRHDEYTTSVEGTLLTCYAGRLMEVDVISIFPSNLIPGQDYVSLYFDAKDTQVLGLRFIYDDVFTDDLAAEAEAREAADAALQLVLETEGAARGAADATLQSALNAEIAARIEGDTALQAALNLQGSISDLVLACIEAFEACGGPGSSGAQCDDTDGDGFFANDEQFCPCGRDCDDDDPVVNPDATEICDGKDNDCDTEVDEGGVCDFVCEADVVLVVDTSGSMTPKFGDLVDGVNALVQSWTLGDEAIRAGLVLFSTESEIVVELTGVGADSLIANALTDAVAEGLTCTSCGLDDGYTELLINGRPDVQKVLVLITDGEPTAGDTTAYGLAGLASSYYAFAGGLTYVIGDQEAPQILLDNIAAAGGTGSAVIVQTFADFPQVIPLIDLYCENP